MKFFSLNLTIDSIPNDIGESDQPEDLGGSDQPDDQDEPNWPNDLDVPDRPNDLVGLGQSNKQAQ